MGVRGPAPTPSAILQLRGTARPDRVNRDEPHPEPAANPDPPPGLRGRARQLWEGHAPELHRLGLLTVLDIESLATWCRAMAAQDRVERRLRALEALERRQERLHRRLLAAGATAGQDLAAASRAIHASLEQQRQWSTERQRLTRELRLHFEMARTLAARFGFTPSDRRSLSTRATRTPGQGSGSNDPHDELARRRAARIKPSGA